MNRIEWVDSAKGICVILVIIGHFLYGSNHEMINTAIYSFHVPAFFMLSGFTHKGSINRRSFIRQKIRKLIVPYVLYTLLSLNRMHEAYQANEVTIKELIEKILYFRAEVFFNYPLWFLIVLFEVFLIEVIINSPFRSITTNLCILVVSILISIYVYQYGTESVFNFFGINRMIVAYVFFQFGIILNKIYRLFKRKTIKARCVILVVVSLLLVTWYTFGMSLNVKVSLYPYILGNLIWFYIAGASGSIALIGLCVLIANRSTWIANISKYSIIFLGTQFFLSDWYSKLMMNKGLLKTMQYDFGMIFVISLYITIIPIVYNIINRKIKLIRILNGEL